MSRWEGKRQEVREEELWVGQQVEDQELGQRQRLRERCNFVKINTPKLNIPVPVLVNIYLCAILWN